MRIRGWLPALTLLLPGTAPAFDADFGLVDNPQQADFRAVAKDVVAVLNSKSLTPAEAGGLTGFGVGVFATYMETDDPGAWQRLTGEKVDEVGVVGIIAEKGLPLGIDLGVSYSEVLEAGARVLGANLRYALVEGDAITPGISVRGSYAQLSGVKDVDQESYGLDLSISKGFGPITPYAGVGYVWSTFEADPDFQLDDEDVDETRLFIGLRLSALIGITPEYERIGERDVFNLRFGLVF